jgi:two-component system phosphate regulon sensor histidine kinase PhoR
VTKVVGPPVERLRPQAERAELDLSVDVPAVPPSVLADVDRMQQVVTNLVHNAIKFTPAGGSIRVTIRELRRVDAEYPEQESAGLESEDWVLITVEDTGVGIPSADLPRIFERFYKADRARSGGGTGLGLAIAKHIVQAHNGHIWAESVEDQGSSFYVALPALTSR